MNKKARFELLDWLVFFDCHVALVFYTLLLWTLFSFLPGFQDPMIDKHPQMFNGFALMSYVLGSLLFTLVAIIFIKKEEALLAVS